MDNQNSIIQKNYIVKRIEEIIASFKVVFYDRTYIAIAIVSALVFGYLLYWLLYQVTTIPAFIQMVQDKEFGPYSYLYASTYWVTTILTVILFGISATFSAWLLRHSKLSKIGSGSGVFGVIAGSLGSACPVCGAFLLSLLGVSGGVAILPMQGLEFKFVSLALIGGSIMFAAGKIARSKECIECNNVSQIIQLKKSRVDVTAGVTPKIQNSTNLIQREKVFPVEKVLISILAALFLVNQLFIGSIATGSGSFTGRVARLFGVKTAGAYTIIAPKLNPDGKTTSLVEQPTITEVPGNPNSGDPVANAKAVVFPTGKPFYAPDDISFDDPINAQNKWGAFKDSITLSGGLQARYNQLTNTFTCNYCCGGPTNVTVIARCGCRHAKAWSGFFKYMLQTYGDKYTNEQLMGEAYRWSGIWYPKGVLEDYLLATGKGNVLGHTTHGGAGADGRHGL